MQTLGQYRIFVRQGRVGVTSPEARVMRARRPTRRELDSAGASFKGTSCTISLSRHSQLPPPRDDDPMADIEKYDCLLQAWELLTSDIGAL